MLLSQSAMGCCSPFPKSVSIEIGDNSLIWCTITEPPFNTFEKNLLLLYNNDSGSQADCGAHGYMPLE